MAIGLDDVVAAETTLSDVDGLAGRLIIRGRSLDELAGHTTAEDLLRLLLDGEFDRLPSSADLAAARTEIFRRFLPELTGLASLARPGRVEIDMATRARERPSALGDDAGHSCADSYIHDRVASLCVEHVLSAIGVDEGERGHARQTFPGDMNRLLREPLAYWRLGQMVTKVASSMTRPK